MRIQHVILFFLIPFLNQLSLRDFVYLDEDARADPASLNLEGRQLELRVFRPTRFRIVPIVPYLFKYVASKPAKRATLSVCQYNPGKYDHKTKESIAANGRIKLRALELRYSGDKVSKPKLADEYRFEPSVTFCNNFLHLNLDEEVLLELHVEGTVELEARPIPFEGTLQGGSRPSSGFGVWQAGWFEHLDAIGRQQDG